MECNKDEGIRAKKIAENKMMNNDFEGARKFALKARKLFPEIENISQLLAVCDVHCSAQRKINGDQMDLYGILEVESLADEATIRKQYRKLALVLHPDKNKFPGAEAAFKLIGEANMILSDKGKRYLHDFKCREPARFIPKPQNHQKNQDSQFSGVNRQQQSQSGWSSFWTNCPFCKMKQEYSRDLESRCVKCRTCSKIYTAFDIGIRPSAEPPHSGHAGTQSSNLGSSTGRPTFSQQGNAKVDPQRAGQSFSHFSYQSCSSTTGDAKVGGSKTKENGNIKGTGHDPSVASDSNGKSAKNHKRSRKRPPVSDSENRGDDGIPQKKSRKKPKVPAAAELKKNVNEAKASVNDEGSMYNDKKENVIPKGDSESNSGSKEDSEPVYIDCPDLEFSNFDKNKEAHCFAVDQIWACYDTIDGMPRFYAHVRKVYSTGFRLRITWLEADPENDQETIWAQEGLPVACGKFVRGETEDTRDRLMFSHQIAYEKVGRFSYTIYPKKGEIWALFKGWDLKWSSDPKSHMKYKYEIVEVLSDFDNDSGVLVAYMVKVEGFVSLFQKTSRARLAEHRIPASELLRFSHRIPSVKLTGKERADIPVGSCELDTASLPDDLDDYYFPNKMKPASGLNNKPYRQDDDLNTSSNGFTKSPQLSSHSDDKQAEVTIHDFNLDKQNRKFQEGQIWAFRGIKNGNLGCYAQIKKIEHSPLRFHVNLLELCNGVAPNACGLFKVCTGGKRIVPQDSFLYLVNAEVNGKNRFNIYPREKEIWVLKNKQDSKLRGSDVDAVVEVLENMGHIIRVLCLSHVPGYKSVFRALEIEKSRVLEIPRADLSRFSYRVPAFLITENQDDHLRGSWELDLADFPGLLPS